MVVPARLPFRYTLAFAGAGVVLYGLKALSREPDGWAAQAGVDMVGALGGVAFGAAGSARTFAAGHAIGTHTYSRLTMPAHGAKRIGEELRRCREAVGTIGEGFSILDGAALMHPPHGRRRPATPRTMREEWYVPVTWSITGYDWRAHTSVKRITRRCKRAEEDAIILLHDGASTEPVADRSRSIDSAGATLEHFAHQGYRFVTVAELVAAAR
jgi:peptidoglycan/xylan/chitin deacetylase (PgdA/CDA1 family)